MLRVFCCTLPNQSFRLRGERKNERRESPKTGLLPRRWRGWWQWPLKSMTGQRRWQSHPKRHVWCSFYSFSKLGFIQSRLILLNEVWLILQYGLMASIRTFDFKKRRHWVVTFATCSKMFMDALCVEFWVTDSPSIVAIAVSDWPFRLANIVETACVTSQCVNEVHWVAGKVPSKFKWFIKTMELKRGALVDIFSHSSHKCRRERKPF